MEKEKIKKALEDALQALEGTGTQEVKAMVWFLIVDADEDWVVTGNAFGDVGITKQTLRALLSQLEKQQGDTLAEAFGNQKIN